MTAPTPLDRLQHVLEAIARVEGYWTGRTYADFLAEEPKRSATERHLLVISEASKHLSDADKAEHPHVPWHEVRAIGNVLRHLYERVEHRELWNVVVNDLAVLRQAIAALIEKHRANSDEGGEVP